VRKGRSEGAISTSRTKVSATSSLPGASGALIAPLKVPRTASAYEHLLELFGRVGFGDADARHPGIVDDDIQVPRVAESVPNRMLHRLFLSDIEFQHLQAELFAVGEAFEPFRRRPARILCLHR
jgi:hypothetical protein